MKQNHYIKWKMENKTIFKTNDFELARKLGRTKNVSLMAEYFKDDQLVSRQYITDDKKVLKKFKLPVKGKKWSRIL